jgi:uncharacterized protein YndB with AHSA1/START domain
MPDLLHAIPVNAKKDAVLKAISTTEGLRSWWTSDCEAAPKIGHVNVFRFGPRTEFHFRVDRHDENGLQWTCIEADMAPAEWVGTTMTFDLTSQDSVTRIDFVHGGWQRADGDMPICNTTWGDLMYRLKDYVEGRPRGPRFS